MTGLNRVQALMLGAVLAVLFHYQFRLMAALGVEPDSFLTTAAFVALIIFAFWHRIERGLERVIEWRSASGSEPL